MIIIVAGVSGTGKSTVGKRLAEQLSLPFYDGDDFHPQANIDKMSNGIALNDEDRAPWLESLAQLLQKAEKQAGAVLACSALKESYRVLLSAPLNEQPKWVFLTGSAELLTERLSSRNAHFFDPSLLTSQLNTLELPDYAINIDVAKPIEVVVGNAVSQILSK